MTRTPPTKRRWPPEAIRAARKVELPPLLEELGYQLQPLPNDNYLILGLPEEIHVKHTYWICTDDGAAGPAPARKAMSGNPIDLLMRIRNLSFHQAMELLRS